jgi:hypothetical protein
MESKRTLSHRTWYNASNSPIICIQLHTSLDGYKREVLGLRFLCVVWSPSPLSYFRIQSHVRYPLWIVSAYYYEFPTNMLYTQCMIPNLTNTMCNLNITPMCSHPLLPNPPDYLPKMQLLIKLVSINVYLCS